MTADDENERLELFVRLLDILAKLQELESEQRGTGTGESGHFGYQIALGPSEDSSDSTSWLVAERRTDVGRLIVVDVPRVETHAVEAAVEDDGILTFRVDGETVERVALPDRGMHVVDRADRNGVLEIRVARSEEGCTRQQNC